MVTPTGGTDPYSYSWSNGQSTQSIDNLVPGLYSVTIVDINNCETSESVYVEEFFCPDLVIQSYIIDVDCFENCDGEIGISNVDNGVAPFYYLWSDDQNTETATGLCVGDYNVTINDALNCSAVSDYYSISEPAMLEFTSYSMDETAFQANDGSAGVTPFGGTPPYTYAWSHGANSQEVEDLAPGIYTVTINDLNACEVEETLYIEAFVCPTLTINTFVDNVICFNDCNGSVEITGITNGTAPFNYEWSNGATSAYLENLCQGNYEVTVIDAYNCSLSEIIEVSEPEFLMVNASSINETANNAMDGEASCNPSGGTEPYSFSWSNGATTQSIENLEPGTYTVEVSDQNNCLSIESVIIQEFVCPEMEIILTQSNTSCFEVCDGSLSISDVANGTAPFTYAWSNGASTFEIPDLCSDLYSVSISDAYNCVITESYYIEQAIELSVNAFSTDETSGDANDGTASCSPSGGTIPYNFLWSNGETSQSIDNLSPGTYSLTVTDANMCMSVESVEIAEFGCLGLSIEANILHNPCYDNCIGEIEITNIQEGVAPYTYQWQDGSIESSLLDLCEGNYSATVVDANNCSVFATFIVETPNELHANLIISHESSHDGNNGSAAANPAGGSAPFIYNWSNGETASSISNLSPGNYELSVTDANGCIRIESFIIEEYLCPIIALDVEQKNATCFSLCDGNISLDPFGGTNPYSYEWDNGEKTSTILNLCAGGYSVTIEDGNNCQHVESFIIQEPEEIIVSIEEVVHVTEGQKGSIDISIDVNNNVLWSGPNNFNSTTEDIYDLQAGCYTLTVTNPITGCSVDSLICIEDLTSTIEIDERSKVLVYPNPTKDELYLDFSQFPKNELIEVCIKNLDGKTNYQSIIQGGKNPYMLNLTFMNSGLYFIQIKGKNIQQISKFVLYK